jgi:hypothetical protein
MIRRIVLFATACAVSAYAGPAFAQFDVGNGFASSGGICQCAGGSWCGGGNAPAGDFEGNGYATEAWFVGNGFVPMSGSETRNGFVKDGDLRGNGFVSRRQTRASRRVARYRKDFNVRNG